MCIFTLEYINKNFFKYFNKFVCGGRGGGGRGKETYKTCVFSNKELLKA